MKYLLQILQFQHRVIYQVHGNFKNMGSPSPLFHDIDITTHMVVGTPSQLVGMLPMAEPATANLFSPEPTHTPIASTSLGIHYQGAEEEIASPPPESPWPVQSTPAPLPTQESMDTDLQPSHIQMFLHLLNHTGNLESPQLTSIYDRRYPNPESDHFQHASTLHTVTAEQTVPDVKDALAILAVDPNNHQAFRLMTEAYFKSRHFQAASEFATRAIALWPQDDEEKINLLKKSAKSKLMLNDYQGAIADAELCIGLNPNDFYAYLIRTEASDAHKDWENSFRYATAAIDKAFEFNLDYTFIGPLLYLRLKASYELKTYRSVILDAVEILKLEPSNIYVKKILIDAKKALIERTLEIAKTDPAGAIDDFTFIIESGKPDFCKHRAQAHLRSGNFNAAVVDATRALAFNLSKHETFIIYDCRARGLLSLKKPRQAIHDINKLLHLAKDVNVNSIHIKKTIYLAALNLLETTAIENFNARNYAEAFADYSLLIDIFREEDAFVLYRAEICIELCNYPQAIADTKRIINSKYFINLRNQEKIRIYSMRGFACAQTNELNEAQNAIQAIQQLDPIHYSIHLIRSMIEFKQEKYADCVLSIEAALKSYPRELLSHLPPKQELSFIYQLLYLAYIQLNRFVEALQVSEQLLDFYPNDPYIQSLKPLAMNRIKQEHIERVQKHLRESITKGDANDFAGALKDTLIAMNIATQEKLDKHWLISCHYAMARVKAKDNDVSGAIENINSAIELEPNNEQLIVFYNIRADLRNDSGDFAGYIRDKEATLALTPESKDRVQIYESLAQECGKQNELLLVREYLIRLLELEPNELKYLDSLYQIYIDTNNFEDAIACMMKIHALRHGDLLIAEALSAAPSQSTARFETTVGAFTLHNVPYAAVVFFHLPGIASPSPLIFPRTIAEVGRLNTVVAQKNIGTITELFGLLRNCILPKADRSFLHKMLKARFMIDGVGETNIIMAMFLLGNDRQKSDLMDFITGLYREEQALALEITVIKKLYGYSLPMLIANSPGLLTKLLDWLNYGPLGKIALLFDMQFYQDPQQLTLKEHILLKTNQFYHFDGFMKFFIKCSILIDYQLTSYALTRAIPHLGTLSALIISKAHGYPDATIVTLGHSADVRVSENIPAITTLLNYFQRPILKVYLAKHFELLFGLLTYRDNDWMTFPMYVLNKGTLQEVLHFLGILNDDNIKRAIKEPENQSRMWVEFLSARVGDTEQTVLEKIEERLQISDERDQLKEILHAWVTEIFSPSASEPQDSANVPQRPQLGFPSKYVS